MKNLNSLSLEEMKKTEGGFLLELLIGYAVGWLLGMLADSVTITRS